MTNSRQCEQCGRVGTRGFKTYPAVRLPSHLGGGMTAPITVCLADKACRSRWPRARRWEDE